MTKLEMARIGKQFREDYWMSNKYHVVKEKQYKYRGQIKTKTWRELNEEGRRIDDLLDTKMFTCPCCGEVVSFNDLESWLVDEPEDIANDKCPCSICYEDDMGEDL